MSLNNESNSKSASPHLEELLSYEGEIRAELFRILDFWSSEAVDEINGGFVGQIDHYGRRNITAPKGMVLNARILWSFSSAYRATSIERYKVAADRAYNYLINHFYDKQFGGFFWEVNYLGRPSNTRKQSYAQGFAIYALSEYNRATGNIESLEYARQLYNLLEEKVFDPKFGGYVEALNTDWTQLEDMRLSPKDANTPKSMNTHLHILEPYTNLYRVWPDAKLKQSILGLLDIFHDKIIDPNTGHFNLFFDYNWDVKSSIVSYGHDIEGAWLMHEAALIIDDKAAIKKVRETAVNLVDITLAEGTDTDGSLFNEREGDHLDTDKHWWPQAEALVGLLDAYAINNNELYINEFVKIWSFIKTSLLDKERGEWYWRVDAKGVANTNDDKAGFWKCPYHNSRALIEILERFEHLK